MRVQCLQHHHERVNVCMFMPLNDLPTPGPHTPRTCIGCRAHAQLAGPVCCPPLLHPAMRCNEHRCRGMMVNFALEGSQRVKHWRDIKGGPCTCLQGTGTSVSLTLCASLHMPALAGMLKPAASPHCAQHPSLHCSQGELRERGAVGHLGLDCG